MFKKCFAALAGLAVILSAGCMEMTSTTTVKKDGTGTITAKGGTRSPPWPIP